MAVSKQVVRSLQSTEYRTVYYTQNDVDVIRAQIIQGESVKRRWLILGLILTTAGMASMIALLSSSYAMYASTQAENKQLTQQHAAALKTGNEAQQSLDELRAREAKQESAKAESQAMMQKLASGMPLDDYGSALSGGKFARAVHQMGGRVETPARPPDKLFRNWKVTGDSASEIYTVVGGFVDGKWVVYSNLIARKPIGESAAGKASQN